MKLALFFVVSLQVFCSESATIDVTPSGSIQDALGSAQPGDTVVLGDVVYEQDIISVRDGTPDKRITITGSKNAVVNGKKQSRMIEINHSYITLDGFSVDGEKSSGKNPEDYNDKLIYVIGTKSPESIRENGAEYESSLDGMVISNMHILNAGGECVRLRSFITNAEVVGNKIENCGVHDFVFPSSTVNGEVIYVGTSSNQWGDSKNSRAGPDLTKYVWIHENELISHGNECVDVKEGTTDVLVEYNVCSDQLDENSAGLDSRTDDIIFRYNDVSGCLGAGIRIGGHTIDGHTYGQNNEVYGNTFHSTEYSSVKTETGESHKMCENSCKGGCSSKGSLGGSYSDIESKCSGMREISWINPGKVTAPTQLEEDDASSSPKTEEEEEDLERDSPEVDGRLELDEESNEPKDSEPNDSEPKDSESKDSEDSGRRLSDVTGCKPATIGKITSSPSQDSPKNAVDGKAVTRWSSREKGSWISMDLKQKTKVERLEMSFYKGDQRVHYFDVYADGKPLLMGVQSSGKTVGLQSFPLPKPTVVQTITIFGKGNSENDWNSFSELTVCGDEENSHDNVEEEEECDTFELNISSVVASSDDGNSADNLIGKDLKTKWSCQEIPCEVVISLEETSYVAELEFAIYLGNKRVQKYDLLVETKSGWEDVIIDGSSKKIKGTQSENIDVNDVSRIKFIGYGNDVNDWTSLVYVDVIGC